MVNDGYKLIVLLGISNVCMSFLRTMVMKHFVIALFNCYIGWILRA